MPLDGSLLSEQVLPIVKRLSQEAAVEITLFRACAPPKATVRRRRGLRRPVPVVGTLGSWPGLLVPPSTPDYAETRGQAVERRDQEVLSYLDKIGRPLLETGCDVHAAVRFGDAATEIIGFAHDKDFELIAMATHGRSGMSETLHGSVTAEVIKSGVAPVLVVRPTAKSEKSISR